MQDVSGTTIKAYRQRLQLTQRDLAELLGTSQGLISLVELGSTRVSTRLMRLLRIKGDEGVLKPSLAEFLGQGELVGTDAETKIQVLSPIPLEKWQVRTNLAKPADLGAPGRVVLPGAPHGARAFQFSPPPPMLAPDTVAVFKPCGLKELTDGQLILVQLRAGRGQRGLPVRVGHLGRVIVSRHRRTAVYQFEPATDNTPVIGLDEENVAVVMLCLFRGRYCP